MTSKVDFAFDSTQRIVFSVARLPLRVRSALVLFYSYHGRIWIKLLAVTRAGHYVLPLVATAVPSNPGSSNLLLGPLSDEWVFGGRLWQTRSGQPTKTANAATRPTRRLLQVKSMLSIERGVSWGHKHELSRRLGYHSAPYRFSTPMLPGAKIQGQTEAKVRTAVLQVEHNPNSLASDTGQQILY
ncbi:hypothetical protein RJ55_05032 [Drechmeria coniospora]|nr:hypothetical protein RJ55_05032 [Drechmeria coniospora]